MDEIPELQDIFNWCFSVTPLSHMEFTIKQQPNCVIEMSVIMAGMIELLCVDFNY